MRKIALSILIFAAGAGAILPGGLPVASPKLVETSSEAGIWYLAESPAGYLYLADRRALPRLAPCRVWHDDPETSTYYLAYEYAPGEAARAGAFGAVAVLGDGVFLLTTTPGRIIMIGRRWRTTAGPWRPAYIYTA
jgi:hypothetical protein